jgi:hypothetical protein
MTLTIIGRARIAVTRYDSPLCAEGDGEMKLKRAATWLFLVLMGVIALGSCPIAAALYVRLGAVR